MKTKPFMPKSHVPSGSYKVSRGKGQLLEAYLGTCMGVTLCDRHANVGGLIHLLLPEPTGMNTIQQPENYATTGLPLFIQALYDAGAVNERLEACVAGGALVGPLSDQDLNLDIGGRTFEIVERIFKHEGIPILKAETGGFFACRLRLNLLTWESSIEPISSPTMDLAENEFKRPTYNDIEIAMEHVRPIPQIALKIIRMTNEYQQSLLAISKEFRQDQILSAKVLRLCNSSFFRTRNKIDSIDRALVLLGEKRLLQLVASAALEDFFPKTVQGYSLAKGGLYKHAFGTAMISEILAKFTGKVSSDIAYTAGLLHDIGKVALDQYIASAYPLFYRRTQIDGMNLIDVEREELGVDHTEVGSRLAEHWSLPENLTDTIRHHHNPEQATVDTGLSHLVYLADLLMSRFLVGQELERLNTNALTSRLQEVGITPEQVPVVIESIPHEIFYD